MDVTDKIVALFDQCTIEQLQIAKDYLHNIAEGDPLLFLAGMIRSKLPQEEKRPLSEICILVADIVKKEMS